MKKSSEQAKVSVPFSRMIANLALPKMVCMARKELESDEDGCHCKETV